MIISKNIVKPVGLLINHLGFIGEGDFTKDVPEQFKIRKDEIGRIGNDIHNIQESLKGLIWNVINESDSIEYIVNEAKDKISELNRYTCYRI